MSELISIILLRLICCSLDNIVVLRYNNRYRHYLDPVKIKFQKILKNIIATFVLYTIQI